MGLFTAMSNSRGWSRKFARNQYLPVCNADGGMLVQRFREVLGVAGIAEDEMDIIISSLDRKSTGFVCLEEFLDFLGYETDIEVIKCTHAMVEAMQNDESKAALKKLFDDIDKNSDGRVTSKEWGSQVGKKQDILAKYFGGATPAEIGQAFKHIDANGDGSLSWDEFAAAADTKSSNVDLATIQMAEVMQTDDGKTALREFFDCLDKDNNGKVSCNEWFSQLGKERHSMLKYFCGSTPAEIGHAFKRIDANGDGSLSWDEFVAAAEAKRANVDATTAKLAAVMQTNDGKEALKEFFDILDKDCDGKVSTKEWCNQLGKKKHAMLNYFCGSTPSEIGHAFKRIDANGDGSLSWEEFVAAADMRAMQAD